MTKVSVLMPVYNANAPHLREAVESILNQTLIDFEFVIVNDGSTDPEVETVIKSYQDPRIKYIKLPQNMGIALARNRALDEASGKFVAFFDSDDVAHPERLAKQVAFMNKHSQVGIVGTAYREIPAGKVSGRLMPSPDLKFYTLLFGCPFCQSSVMARRDIIEKHNLRCNLNNKVAIDYTLWLDFVNLCEFANMEDVLVRYRWHSQNVSNKNPLLQEQTANQMRYEKLCELAKPGRPEAAQSLLKMAQRQLLGLKEFEQVVQELPEMMDNLIHCGIDEKVLKYWLGKLIRRQIKKSKSRDELQKKMACFHNCLVKFPLWFKLQMRLRSICLK